MPQLREMKNAIQMGHFANLGAMLESIAKGDRTVHVIGHVLGRATGISYRANPNDPNTPTIAVTGQFEATSVDGNAPVMVAPAIFLPTAFCRMLETELIKGVEKIAEKPKKAPAKGKAVNVEGVCEIPLALEIGIRKNEGASGVGYEFSVVQAQSSDGKISDPFADLRALLPGKTTAAIADQSGGAAKPAPKKSARKK